MAGLVDAERRGNSELPEKTELGKSSRSQRFCQGALSGGHQEGSSTLGARLR